MPASNRAKPLVPKLVFRFPLASNLARNRKFELLVVAAPPTTVLPSDKTTAVVGPARAWPVAPGTEKVNLPPVPKLLSSEPSALKRARASTVGDPGPNGPIEPGPEAAPAVPMARNLPPNTG